MTADSTEHAAAPKSAVPAPAPVDGFFPPEVIDALAAGPGFVSVTRGQPTPEELAAVVAVIATLAKERPAPTAPADRWSGPAARLRPARFAGPRAWTSASRAR